MSYIICNSCYSDFGYSDSFRCDCCEYYDLCLRCKEGASSHFESETHALLRLDGGLAAADVLYLNESPEAALKREAPKLSFFGHELSEGELQSFSNAMRGNTTLKELSLRNAGLKADDAKLIVSILQGNRSLTMLDLSGNSLGAEVGTIARGLFQTEGSAIEFLDVSKTEMTDGALEILCEVMKTNKSVKTLALRRNDFDSNAGKPLAEMIRKNTTLTALLLSNNVLSANEGEDPIKDIVDALLAAFVKRKRLSWTHRKSGTSSSLPGTKIQALDFESCLLTHSQLQHFGHLIESGFFLRRLNLSENFLGWNVQDDDLLEFVGFFESLAKGSGLEYLSMLNTGVLRTRGATRLFFSYDSESDDDEDGTGEITNSDARRRKREEVQMKIGAAMGKALANNQPSETLRLRDGSFTQGAAEKFAEGLIQSDLKNLQLVNFDFAKGAQERIVKAIEKSKLESINWCWSPFANLKIAKIFALSVEMSSTLQFIWLSRVPSGGGRALAQSLRRNSFLKSLMVEDGDLRGEGGLIAQALSAAHNDGESSVLESLLLWNCSLGSGDIAAFANLIKNNESKLRFLNLGKNDIRQQEVHSIAKAMEVNQKIESLVMTKTGIRDEDVDVLRQMLARNSTLKYFVVTNTVLSVLGFTMLWVDNEDIVVSNLQNGKEFKAISEFVRQQGVSILHSIPERILEINSPQERTQKLLEHIVRFKNGVGSIKQAKVLIVGAGNAGKTSLCNCIMNGAKDGKPVLAGASRATIGVNVTNKTVTNLETGEEGELFLWDFGGQEDYFMTHSFFLSRRSVVVVVVDLNACNPDEPASFEKHVGQWLRALQAQVSRPKVILIGTKADLVVKNSPKREGFDPVAFKMDSLRKQIVNMNDALRDEMDNHRVRMEKSRSATRLEEYRRIKMLNSLEFFAGKQGSIGYTTTFEDRSTIQDFLDFLVEVATDSKYGIVLSVPKDVERFSKAILGVEKKVLLTKDDEARSLCFEMEEKYFDESIELLHDVGQVVWLKNDPRLKNQIFIRPQWIVDIFASVFRHDMFENKEAKKGESSDGYAQKLVPPLTKEELAKLRDEGIVKRRTLESLWKNSPNPFVQAMDGEDFTMCINLLVSLGLVSDAVPQEKAGGIFKGGENAPYLIPFYCRTKNKKTNKKKKVPMEKLEYVYEFFTYLPHGLFTRFVANCNLSLEEAYQSRLVATVPDTDFLVVAYESRVQTKSKRASSATADDDLIMESTLGGDGRGRIIIVGELPLTKSAEHSKRRSNMLEYLQSTREHFEKAILSLFPSVPYRSYIKRHYLNVPVIVPVHELHGLLTSGFRLEKVKLLMSNEKPQLRETIPMYKVKRDPMTRFFVLPDAKKATTEATPNEGSFYRSRTSLGRRRSSRAKDDVRIPVPMELVAPNSTLLEPPSADDLFMLKKSYLRALRTIEEQRQQKHMRNRLVRLLFELEQNIVNHLPGKNSHLSSYDPLRGDLREVGRSLQKRMAEGSLLDGGEDFELIDLLKRRVETLRRLVSRIRLPFDVFMSHAWKADGLGRDNHKRVGLISRELTKRGFNPWFDEKYMTESRGPLGDTGRIDQNMLTAIPNSEVSCLFLTHTYLDKIKGTNTHDNCQREFNFIKNVRPGKDTIPVKMETDLELSMTKFGFEYGEAFYVDCSENDPDAVEEDDAFREEDIGLVEEEDEGIDEDNEEPLAWPTVLPLAEALDQLEKAILQRLFEFDGLDIDDEDKRASHRRKLLEMYPATGREKESQRALEMES